MILAIITNEYVSYQSIQCCENLDKKLQKSLTKNCYFPGKIGSTQSACFCGIFSKCSSTRLLLITPKVGVCQVKISTRDICIAAQSGRKMPNPARRHQVTNWRKKPIDRILSRCRQDWSPPKLSLSPSCRRHQSGSSRHLRTDSNVKQHHELALLLNWNSEVWPSWKFQHKRISEYICVNKFTQTDIWIYLYKHCQRHNGPRNWLRDLD